MGKIKTSWLTDQIKGSGYGRCNVYSIPEEINRGNMERSYEKLLTWQVSYAGMGIQYSCLGDDYYAEGKERNTHVLFANIE